MQRPGCRRLPRSQRRLPRSRMTLKDVRLVDDLPVSGTATWDPSTGMVRATLRVPRSHGVDSVTASWNATDADAQASVRLSGSSPTRLLEFLAP